jgi:hypothetical protein
MIHINAKRIRKSSGTERDNQRVEDEKARRALKNAPEPEEVEEEDLTKDERGVARSQANPFTDKHEGKDKYGFWTSFKSSNIEGIKYDGKKRQLWVRFLGGEVYTYFDVPITVGRGFYSAPSKGHYFWEKIRKNRHIKYQRLTASLHFDYVGLINLDSAIQREASVKSVCKSLKKKLAAKHPNWEIKPELVTIFNGFEIITKPYIFDIVRYGRFLRLDIVNRATKEVDFFKTDLLDNQDVVAVFLERIENQCV